MTLIIQKPTGAKLNLAKTFTWNETIWNPSMITTALWLDANDSATITQSSSLVSQVNDKSGNARHATSSGGNRPTYEATGFNNLPTLVFNGGQWLLADSLASVLSGDDAPFTWFVAGRVESNSANYSLISLASSANNNNHHTFDILSGKGRFARRGDSFTDNTIVGSTDIGLLDFVFFGVFAGTTASLFVNGSSYASGTLDATAPVGINQFSIGVRRRSTNDIFCVGDISEVVVLNSAASVNTRQRIEGYLAHKWGLTANLPNDHPYKTVGPTP